MTVYVDTMRARFGRMIMCHMWAGRIVGDRYELALDELLDMADRIGVQRKWLQAPPKAAWVHFDISLGKRELAIKHGAKITDRYGPVEHTARLRGDDAMLLQIDRLRERRVLA